MKSENLAKEKRGSDKQTSVKVGDITTHHTVAGFSAAKIRQLFDGLYAEIDKRANTSTADREDTEAEVKEIQSNVTKAVQKNEKVVEGFLSRRFRNITPGS